MEMLENFPIDFCDCEKGANLVFNVAETLTSWKLKPSTVFVPRLVKNG